MSYIFLATPYEHEDYRVMQDRDYLTTEITAKLMNRDQIVYSPITYGHAIASRFDLPTDYAFWLTLNDGFLERASALYIVDTPGWQASLGVKHEFDLALARNIPTYLIHPDTLELTNLQVWPGDAPHT